MKMLFFESELALPFKLVMLPLRSVAVKTTKGVIVISPIHFSKHQIKEIKEMGEVVALVEPSLIHNLYIEHAVEHFPEAEVWGPVGIRTKCPKVHWDKIVGKDKWPYGKELEVQPIKGMPKVNEMAFFDRELGALIAGDFFFNILHPSGWAAPLILSLLGVNKRFAMSRYFKYCIKDKAQFKKSVEKIINWDFDHVIPAHGEIVPTRGKRLVVNALKERGFKFKKKDVVPNLENFRLAMAS